MTKNWNWFFLLIMCINCISNLLRVYYFKNIFAKHIIKKLVSNNFNIEITFSLPHAAVPVSNSPFERVFHQQLLLLRLLQRSNLSQESLFFWQAVLIYCASPSSAAGWSHDHTNYKTPGRITSRRKDARKFCTCFFNFGNVFCGETVFKFNLNFFYKWVRRQKTWKFEKTKNLKKKKIYTCHRTHSASRGFSKLALRLKNNQLKYDSVHRSTRWTLRSAWSFSHIWDTWNDRPRWWCRN